MYDEGRLFCGNVMSNYGLFTLKSSDLKKLYNQIHKQNGQIIT